MRDEAMKQFLADFGAIAGREDLLWPMWKPWCELHDEQPGTYPEFVGRLHRYVQHLARRSRAPVKLTSMSK